jgi:hypothetical protein
VVQELYAGPGGTLGGARPAEQGRDEYVVDPTVGLHLLPWDPQTPIVPMPYDRSADDHRAQTYTTEPLRAALELSGDPEAVIALTADQPDFPLSVWLCDVAPDGRSTLICQGWTSAAQAAGAPLRRDQTYTLRVPLYSTSYRIPAGHRLRLGVAGADFPLLWPAPRNPHLVIQRSPAAATHVRIPVVPIKDGARPGPAFGAPALARGTRGAGGREENVIVRDLGGASAEFRQTSEGMHRLDDGSVLRMLTANTSTIEASRPGEMTLRAHVEAEVRRPVDAVVVTVEAIQTAERYHIEGRITVDGTPFFARSWDLDL